MNAVSIARALAAGSFALVLLTGRASRADDADPADAPAPAAAPRRRPFGAEGTVVLDDVLGFGLTSGYAVIGAPFGPIGTPVMSGWLSYNDAKQEIAGRSQRVTTFGVTPSADVFVAPRLSLGSQLSAFRATVRSEIESTFTGAAWKPRIGYVFPIGDDLSFWLRGFGSFTVAHVTNESSPQVGGAATNSEQTTLGWGFGAEGALVAPLGRHVVLTFGPTSSYGKVDAFDDGPAALSRSGVSLGVRGGVALVL